MKLRRFLVTLIASAVLHSTPALATNVTIALENAHQDELSQAFRLIQQGNPGEADAIFTRVIASYENQTRSDQDYFCARNIDEAARVAARAMVLSTGEVTILGSAWCDAIFGHGYALIDLNRSDESEPFLARAVRMAPTRAHYVNEYAEWFKSRRQWQRSHDLFEQAWGLLEHDPNGAERLVAARALRGMGFNQIELGDLDKAEQLFRQSQEYDRDNPNVANELRYIAQLRRQRRN